ncbi:hypothetical protein TcWFU_007639 [Taenia crassiceps]|uniref:Uncharacterized protein n=1 Tax=Taenia crassiceps TaxID=6207 RepID=A0ABR4QM25_9CEST
MQAPIGNLDAPDVSNSRIPQRRGGEMWERVVDSTACVRLSVLTHLHRKIVVTFKVGRLFTSLFDEISPVHLIVLTIFQENCGWYPMEQNARAQCEQ